MCNIRGTRRTPVIPKRCAPMIHPSSWKAVRQWNSICLWARCVEIVGVITLSFGGLEITIQYGFMSHGMESLVKYFHGLCVVRRRNEGTYSSQVVAKQCLLQCLLPLSKERVLHLYPFVCLFAQNFSVFLRNRLSDRAKTMA